MKIKDMTPEQYQDLCDEVLGAIAGGMSMKAVGTQYQLNHTQVDAITYRARITDEDREAFFNGGSTLSEQVIAARDSGLSWGWIGYVAGVSEGAVRTAYAKGSGKKSQGQRIGKGGRFYYRDGVLYEDTLKPTGTVIPVGTDHAGATALSYQQRIERLDWDGLVRLASAKGVERKPKEQRTAFTNRVLSAYGVGKAEPTPKAKKPTTKRVVATEAEATEKALDDAGIVVGTDGKVFVEVKELAS